MNDKKIGFASDADIKIQIARVLQELLDESNKKPEIKKIEFNVNNNYRIDDCNGFTTFIDIKATPAYAQIVIHKRGDKTYSFEQTVSKKETIKEVLSKCDIEYLLKKMHREPFTPMWKDLDIHRTEDDIQEALARGEIDAEFKEKLFHFLRSLSGPVSLADWLGYLDTVRKHHEKVTIDIDDYLCTTKIPDHWQDWFNETWVPFVEQLEY